MSLQIHRKYARYIVRHKYYVFRAGRCTKAPLWRLLIHDWSKLLPSEWVPYARYFYGYERGKQPPGVQDAFNLAWKHHQRFNLHHWQGWILQEDSGATKVLEMPESYVREMVADWAGAGRAITGKWEVREWYKKNALHIKLHEDTRVLVRRLLEQTIWPEA